MVFPALPEEVRNLEIHWITINVVKLNVQSKGQAPSTAQPCPSVPMQLQLPNICKMKILQEFKDSIFSNIHCDRYTSVRYTQGDEKIFSDTAQAA